METPQTLSPIDKAADLSSKVRPFVVLEQTDVQVDHSGAGLQDRPILGVNCTSKDFLVEGRPHISFRINGEGKDTYALVDSVRHLSSLDQNLNPHQRLTDEKMLDLRAELDKGLRPEQKFFVKKLWSKKGIMPGEVRNIETIDAKGPAIILIKRGKYVTNDHIDCSDDFNDAIHETRFTPYLAMYFHNTNWTGSLRGINPNNIKIIGIHEMHIREKLGQVQEKTIENIINQIRRKAGLPTIRCSNMQLNHSISFRPFLRLLVR